MKKMLPFSAAIFLPSALFGQQIDPLQYNKKEADLYFSGLSAIKNSGWNSLDYRVSKVANQLVEYSSQHFNIVPGQTNEWGQAHVGGWIIFDISSAASPEPIMAFRLAHEWGHEALGHQPNLYHPMGGPWQFQPSSTTAEDEADAYAGRFLARFRYPLSPVLSELQNLLKSSDKDSHSDGVVRAGIVSRAYNSVIMFRSEEPLCRSMQNLFAGGSAFLRKSLLENKRIFEKFN
jgi:hypothetical protein